MGGPSGQEALGATLVCLITRIPEGGRLPAGLSYTHRTHLDTSILSIYLRWPGLVTWSLSFVFHANGDHASFETHWAGAPRRFRV